MKQLLLCGLFFFFYLNSQAQNRKFELTSNFSQNGLLPTFYGAQDGGIVSGDIDNDGDLDVIEIGRQTRSFGLFAKVHLNDGLGNFTIDRRNNLQVVLHANMELVDIDGDSDLDLVMVGQNGFYRLAKTMVYFNDGTGNFSSFIINPFIPVYTSSMDIADVDGDSDLDVLITGRDTISLLPASARLYLNDGTGQFILDTNNIFLKADKGDVVFDDFDNDGDQDVVLSSVDTNKIILYKNNGFGVFSIDTSIHFGLGTSTNLSSGDYNNDGFSDIIISGELLYSYFTRYFVNDGLGNFFSDTVNVGLIEQFHGTVVSEDFNGDGVDDILQCGTGKIYFGSSSGTLNKDDWSITGLFYEGSAVSGDFNGDGKMDLILGGEEQNNYGITRLFINSGNGKLEAISGDQFIGVHRGFVDMADIDGDLDLDVLISGATSSNPYSPMVTDIYRNNGNGNFSLDSTNALAPVYGSDGKCLDVDNDNDMDIVLIGQGYNFHYIAYVYQNNGQGNYSILDTIDIGGIHKGDLDNSDIDGDGDQDLIIIGGTTSYYGNNTLRLCVNNGSGKFTQVSTSSFTIASQNPTVDFFDANGDGYSDVLITGYYNYNGVADLYLNDGSGNFVKDSTAVFVGAENAAVGVADIDGDSDIDVLITGETSNNVRTSKLYLNNGNGVFTEKLNHGILGANNGSVEFSDFDNDGDQDVLVCGYDENRYNTSYLYLNDGQGTFAKIKGSPIGHVFEGKSKWGDVDGDGFKDLVVIGALSVEKIPSARLYLNKSCVQSATIYTNDSVLVASTIANYYQWLDCDNNMSPIPGENEYYFQPSKNGNYAVMVAEEGCYDTSACYTVNDMGIEDDGADKKFYASIYPNPFSESLTLMFNEKLPFDSFIKVFDIRGQLIGQVKPSSEKTITLNIKGPKGLYFIEVGSSSEVYRFKALKN